MPHGHGPTGHHDHDARDASTRRLALVLALTVVYTVAEALGGWWANSLALLADAGHMLTDDLALSLALAAAWFARRPPDSGRTYGYQRVEILAALVNGVALVAVCGLLFWEAFRRLAAPPEVRTGLMAVVAAGGLAVNVGGALLLREHRHGLNARAAFLHVVGDLLGSVGALAAAALMAMFGWWWADPAATFLIGGIIVWSSLRLVMESVNVLLEGAPGGVDVESVRRCLAAIQGVGGVHDLHLWSLRGGTPILTAHLVTDHSRPAHAVLRDATACVRDRFGISHATLQIEPPDFNIQGLPGGAG